MWQDALDWMNGVSRDIVSWEIETLLKPFVNGIMDGIAHTFDVFVESIPEIGALYTIICAGGLMLTGNAPKWLARWALGIGGAIICLLV